ncbi:hypothetical protein Droror1_Dr00006950 [Drosera rotundifolia]
MVQEEPVLNRSQPGNSSNDSDAAQGEEMSILVIEDSVESPATSTVPTDTRSVHIKLHAIIQEEDSHPMREENLRQRKLPYLKIQKVPQILKDLASVSNKSCYEPLVISLGPFHHGKARYKYMQDLKIRISEQFIAGTNYARSDIFRKFHQVARRAKDEYYSFDQHEKRPFTNDDDLIDILFTDACFLVQFILSYLDTDEKKRMKVKMKMYEIAFVIRDMFLLENQLPFPLVKSLMELRFEEHEIRQKIKQFIDRVRFTPIPQQRQASFAKKLCKLLSGTIRKKLPPTGSWDLQNDPIHLLQALQIRLVDHKKLGQLNTSTQNATLFSYRSVSELVTAGFDFKAGKSWCQFTDIWFQEKSFGSPVLILPPMTVDDSTPAMLLNLVAFEALPDAPDDLGVTSFLWFMDSLIDTAEDVKELRSKGILVNFLGSDEQVAQMFNSITDQLVPNMDAYASVKAGIEGHFRSRRRVWFSQWMHAHFSTPWTTIGFFAALIAVFLSFIQAYFSAFPRG